MRSCSLLVVSMLVACGTQTAAPSPVCQDLCHTLVVSCAYDAYPTEDDCFQGCSWDEAHIDVDSLSSCIKSADADGTCDTFAILECEHTYGPSDTGASGTGG